MGLPLSRSDTRAVSQPDAAMTQDKTTIALRERIVIGCTGSSLVTAWDLYAVQCTGASIRFRRHASSRFAPTFDLPAADAIGIRNQLRQILAMCRGTGVYGLIGGSIVIAGTQREVPTASCVS